MNQSQGIQARYEASLQQLLEEITNAKLIDQWLTSDARKNRDEVWPHAIIQKDD